MLVMIYWRVWPLLGDTGVLGTNYPNHIGCVCMVVISIYPMGSANVFIYIYIYIVCGAFCTDCVFTEDLCLAHISIPSSCSRTEFMTSMNVGEEDRREIGYLASSLLSNTLSSSSISNVVESSSWKIIKCMPMSSEMYHFSQSVAPLEVNSYSSAPISLPSFSIELWVKPEVWGGSGSTILSIGGLSVGQLREFKAAAVYMYDSSTSTDNILCQTEGMPSGIWHHLAFTYSPLTNLRCFQVSMSSASMQGEVRPDKHSLLNSTMYSHSALTGGLQFSDFLLGGRRELVGSTWSGEQSITKRFVGVMKEFRVWGRDLQREELDAQLYTVYSTTLTVDLPLIPDTALPYIHTYLPLDFQTQSDGTNTTDIKIPGEADGVYTIVDADRMQKEWSTLQVCPLKQTVSSAYDKNNICENCQAGVLHCQKTPGGSLGTLTCDIGTYLKNGSPPSCVTSIACYDGDTEYLPYNGICYSCGAIFPSCATCTCTPNVNDCVVDSWVCRSCLPGYFFTLESECVEECPPNAYALNGVKVAGGSTVSMCVNCERNPPAAPKCLLCPGNSRGLPALEYLADDMPPRTDTGAPQDHTQANYIMYGVDAGCEECGSGYKTQNGVCVLQCLGLYYQGTQGHCLKCEIEDCVECSSPTLCTQCLGGKYPIGDTCYNAGEEKVYWLTEGYPFPLPTPNQFGNLKGFMLEIWFKQTDTDLISLTQGKLLMGMYPFFIRLRKYNDGSDHLEIGVYYVDGSLNFILPSGPSTVMVDGTTFGTEVMTTETNIAVNDWNHLALSLEYIHNGTRHLEWAARTCNSGATGTWTDAGTLNLPISNHNFTTLRELTIGGSKYIQLGVPALNSQSYIYIYIYII